MSRSESLGTFEMVWDCPYCATKGLLGKTNRHCPNCGAPQDPEKRYFPPDGQEKEVVNHVYEGADKVCPACSTPMGAKANNCRSCGSALDGSKNVALRPDEMEGKPKAPPKVVAVPPAKKGIRPWMIAVGALVAFVGVCTTWKKEVHAEVEGHSWVRTVEVESFGPRSESAWCDSMPFDAYSVSRSSEVRDHRKVPDGETCETRKVDKGDGTFEKRKECKPKYRDEPIYADKCHFRVDRWAHERSVRAEGKSVKDTPSWPDVRLSRTGTCLGCEREGSRSETYTVHLRAAKDEYTCDVSPSSWVKYEQGQKVELKVRVVTGGADCSSLPWR